MKPKPVTRNPAHLFAAVRKAGLTLPDVEATTRYDGSPILRLGGVFMAGLASHASAEVGTLVVRMAVEERDVLVEEAPETYYVTDHYRPHPVVLVRLLHIDQAALRDLLSTAWRMAAVKAKYRGRAKRPS